MALESTVDKGVKRFLKQLALFQERQIADIQAVVFFNLGEKIKERIWKKFAGSKSGRWYNVPGTGVAYQASSPGEPPAIATGHLRQTIALAIIERGLALKITAGGKVAPYAAFLELQKNRPFFFDSVAEETSTRDWKEEMKDLMEDALRSVR